MKDNNSHSYNPPYISANIWHAFFTKMQNRNKPKDLTVSSLKEYGLASGQEPALLSALKFLGLLDSQAKTTEKFNLIQASGEQFKKNLKTLIQESYADLIDKHPLQHSTYEDLENYFRQKFSTASAKKMSKSFAILCQAAGIESTAFSKMRSLDISSKTETSRKPKPPDTSGRSTRKDDVPPPKPPKRPKEEESASKDLVKEFVQTNPMPSGVNWDANTVKAFFEEYRETIKMLKELDEG